MYTREEREDRVWKNPRRWTKDDIIDLPFIVLCLGIAGILTVLFIGGITALAMVIFSALYIQISPVLLGAILLISIGAAVFGSKVK